MKIGVVCLSDRFGEWENRGGFNFHLPLSGTDRPLLWLGNCLADAGYDVSLITNNPPSGVSRLQSLRFHETRTLVTEAKAGKVSVLICPFLGDDVTVDVIRQAEAHGLRLIIWDQNGPTRKVADAVERATCVTDHVCVSMFQVDSVRHRRIFSKLRLVVNPIDKNFWNRNAAECIGRAVVYLGSLTPSKGFHHLAQAWPGVIREVSDARLLVCGSAKLYNRKNVVGPLGVADENYERTSIMPFLGGSLEEVREKGVEFLGLSDPIKTRDAISRAQIGVVNPNTNLSLECCSMASLELQSCGLAVIGGRKGGLLETVSHRKSGILVRNVNELKEAIIELLSNPARAKVYGDYGRENLSRYEQDKVFNAWTSLLESGGSKARTPLNFRLFPIDGRRYAKRVIQCIRRGAGFE